MLPRERILAALSPEGTPDIPVVVPYEGIFYRDHWEQVTAHPWWYAYSPIVEDQLAWRRDALPVTGQDWYCLPNVSEVRRREDVTVRTQPDQAVFTDRRTGRADRVTRPRVGGWTGPQGASQSVHPPSPPQTRDEIDEALPLPRATGDRAGPCAGTANLTAALHRACGQDYFALEYASSPIWVCYGLWGFTGMMTLIADRPDLVQYACQRGLVRQLDVVRRARALGADGIWIEDCFTDMIAPEAFRSLNVSPLRPLVEEISALGMASIYYYCGNPSGKWAHLLDVGADALSLEESKKGFRIDIEDVVARVQGRCAVLGNLDAIGVLQEGSDEHTRDEIARQIAAGRRNGSRFIMSLGSPVTPGTHLTKVRRYCALAHALGAA